MKIWLKGFLFLVALILLLIVSLVSRVDRTPLDEQDFYTEQKSILDTVTLHHYTATEKLRASWAKISITPDHPMPMAGYRMREDFEDVHDSLYVRIIALDNGAKKVFLISADLLLFPPKVKQRVTELLSQSGSAPFLYFSATHTHNGIGGWHPSVVGEAVLGKYDEAWVNTTAEKLVKCIQSLQSKLLPATISYFEANAGEHVQNRLAPGAPTDGWLRGLKIVRSDSSTAHVVTFSGHATSISKKSKTLSGDYPAAMIDSLLIKNNSFGMFMAGMVGSHRIAGFDKAEFELAAQAGGFFQRQIATASLLPLADSLEFVTANVPLRFGDAQLRIAENWRLRSWAFSSLVNPLKGELTYLQLGNVVLLGTPCDFSGELFVTKGLAEIASANNKKLIITSFNGEYVGYITEDSHYETSQKEEVMGMNWVGPYYGDYFSEIITTLLKNR